MTHKHDTYRGTGRTTRMLERVADGDTVVIHAANFLPYIRRLAEKVGKMGLRFVVVSHTGDLSRLRGLSRDRVHWDHAASDELYVAWADRVELG